MMMLPMTISCTHFGQPTVVLTVSSNVTQNGETLNTALTLPNCGQLAVAGSLNPPGTCFDVTGSTTVNTLNFTINLDKGTVFYRMVDP